MYEAAKAKFNDDAEMDVFNELDDMIENSIIPLEHLVLDINLDGNAVVSIVDKYGVCSGEPVNGCRLSLRQPESLRHFSMGS